LREIFERQELCHARMSEAGFFAATAIYRAQLSQNSGQIIEQGITATFVRSRQQIGETIIAARAAIRGEQSLLHSRIHALFTPACLLLQNAALKLVKERQKAEIEFHGDAEGLPPATAKLRILAFMALNTSVAPLASYQVGGQISCPHPDRIYEFWVGSTGPLPAPRPVAQQTTDHPAVLERLEAAAKEQAARQAADVQEKNAWVAKEKAEALLRQNSQ